MKKFLLEAVGTIIGAFIMATAVAFFLLPNESMLAIINLVVGEIFTVCFVV